MKFLHFEEGFDDGFLEEWKIQSNGCSRSICGVSTAPAVSPPPPVTDASTAVSPASIQSDCTSTAISPATEVPVTAEVLVTTKPAADVNPVACKTGLKRNASAASVESESAKAIKKGKAEKENSAGKSESAP